MRIIRAVYFLKMCTYIHIYFSWRVYAQPFVPK